MLGCYLISGEMGVHFKKYCKWSLERVEGLFARKQSSISHSKCKFHANSAHLFRAFCFLILSFTPITALFQCQNRFLSLHRYVYNLHSACPCRQALQNASKERVQFFCNANFTFGIKRVKCNKILSRARIWIKCVAVAIKCNERADGV